MFPVKRIRPLDGVRDYSKLFPTRGHEMLFYFAKFVQMRILFANEEAKTDEKGKKKGTGAGWRPLAFSTVPRENEQRRERKKKAARKGEKSFENYHLWLIKRTRVLNSFLL